ncbi:GSO1, partial [Symbiodinium sp. KB8]
MWLCLPGAAGFRGFLSARPVPADCLDCEQVMRCGAFTLLSFSRQAVALHSQEKGRLKRRCGLEEVPEEELSLGLEPRTATSSKRAEDRKDPEIDARLTNLLGRPWTLKGSVLGRCSSLLHGPWQGPSPEALRSILLSLGVAAEELRGNPEHWQGVEIDVNGCVWKLDLTGRPISGTLDALANLTTLEFLYLKNTGVTGSLQALAEMTELRKLWLHDTKVAGDLRALFKLTKLKQLILRNTGVNGGLQALGDMTELRRLWLEGTKVAGDLQPLFKLTKLKQLQLSDTGVTGGLQALGDMSELRKLRLDGTKVAGDLQPLFNLTKLEELLLRNTGVTGGLQALAEMSELQKLWLHGTKVAGELQPLFKLTKLEQLQLSDTGVTGGLQALAEMTELQKLWLYGTKVAGDLQPLSKLTKLKELSLTNTGVSAGLQALGNMSELQKLRLGGTQVAGDLQPLFNLTKLEALSLENTGVQGDLGELIHLTNLEQADLGGTRVSGRLTPAWRGQLLQLHTLSLKGSQVNFLPVGRDLEDLRATFFTEKTGQLLPALVNLDVALCPLDGEVENLLQPLSFAGHLASIRASGANLSGHLRKSCLREVYVDGRFYSEHCAIPLQSSLQGVELADNKIDRIEGIPANVYVSLANNSETYLDVKELRQALDRNVQVDLTSTKISNTDDVATLFHEE